MELCLADHKALEITVRILSTPFSGDMVKLHVDTYRLFFEPIPVTYER